MRSIVAFAEEHSLRIAALGVSSAGRELFEPAGLRALYIGDEAIIDTAAFSVEGRGIRKVRQSVTRLEKGGYAARVAELGAIDDGRRSRELEAVGEDWREGAPERGFSMAMDSLRNPRCGKTLVVYAVDAGRTDRRVPAVRPDLRARRGFALADAPPRTTPRTGSRSS